jgi:hypothetical protein
MVTRLLTAIAVMTLLGLPALEAASPIGSMARLMRGFPQTSAQYRAFPESGTDPLFEDLEEACRDLRIEVERIPFAETGPQFRKILANLEQLISARQSLDQYINEVLKQRHQLEAVAAAAGGSIPDDNAMAAVRGYLRATNALVDLSGRVHEHTRGAINHAALGLAAYPDERHEMFEMFLRLESRAGASIAAYALNDPAPQTFNNARPASLETKRLVLDLIRKTRQDDVLPILSDLLYSQRAAPRLAIEVAETVLEIGLPQEPDAAQSSEVGTAPLLPSELIELMRRIPASALDEEYLRRRDAIIARLSEYAEKGLTTPSLRIGRLDVRPGDWLLIRNPSPYNLFTNISPGLFTHVGVVAEHRDSRGIRRLVVVEILEQGTRIQYSNVDAYLQVTLNYVFLRHRDPAVARKMAERALEAIGRPCRFDLAFQLQGAERLKGRPLANEKIETYCAGMLLLCAQETGLPVEQFFPLPEKTLSPRVMENLHRMGMAVGTELVSPTGPLFAQDMEMIGRRDALWDPSREIEQAIFDHFAERILADTVYPKANLYQGLRQQIAEMSQENAYLAGVLATLGDVDAETDLAAAARAAAVVEALDEVAYGQSEVYRDLWNAFRAGPRELMERRGLNDEAIRRIEELRTSQGDLWESWIARRINPLELRSALVNQCIEKGERMVDSRFFRPSE